MKNIDTNTNKADPRDALKSLTFGVLSGSPTHKVGVDVSGGLIRSKLDEPLVILGDLQQNGFKVLHCNQSSAQDSFAISKDGNTFVVCDGMGSYRSSGTLARLLAPLVATRFHPNFVESHSDFHSFLNRLLLEIKDSTHHNDPLEYENSKLQRRAEGGSSTLSIVHRLSATTFQCTVAGDSPIFILHSSGELRALGVKPKGENITGVAIGISNGNVQLDCRSTTTLTVTLEPGDKLVVATDWIDNLWFTSRDGALNEAQKLTDSLTTARATGKFTGRNGTKELPYNPGYENTMLRRIKGQIDLAILSKPFELQLRNLAGVTALPELSAIVAGKRGPDYKVEQVDDATVLIIDADRLPPVKR